MTRRASLWITVVLAIAAALVIGLTIAQGGPADVPLAGLAVIPAD
jgi:hypothetical protein